MVLKRSVFLSSTYRDLAAHRAAAIKEIERLGGYDCIAMEQFVASDRESDEFCRAKVRECDVFIAVVGHLYGSQPPGSEQSYSEREYDAAEMHRKPVLVLLAADDVAVPMNLIEPDAIKRQQVFRKRVAARLYASFMTPEDLATEIVLALHNWEREQAEAEHAKADDNAPPKLGLLVSKLCDRQTQENEFVWFFQQTVCAHPAAPQVYVLPGAEPECHESLVERFCHKTLETLAEPTSATREGGVALQKVPWPFEGDVAERQLQLQVSLFRKFDPTLRSLAQPLSAATFVKLCLGLQRTIVVVQHNVLAERWDRSSPQMIEWYLQFWDEIAAIAAKPQFICFLNVVYPNTTGRGVARDRVRKKIKEFFNRIVRERAAEAAMRCRVERLTELTSVRKPDVIEWFSDHHILEGPAERLQRSEDLFRAGPGIDALPMAEIESALTRIVKEYAQQRGQL